MSKPPDAVYDDFSLNCWHCDDGMNVESYEQAIDEGWTEIEHNDGLGWNYLGLCPDCREIYDG